MALLRGGYVVFLDRGWGSVLVSYLGILQCLEGAHLWGEYIYFKMYFL